MEGQNRKDGIEMSGVITPEQSLGEIVGKYPLLSGFFEKNGIDYCCGGKETLREAAAEHNIDENNLIKQLEKELERLDEFQADEITWETRPASELVDYIVARHHGYIKQNLPDSEAHLRKILQVHSEVNPDEMMGDERAIVRLPKLLTAFLEMKESISKHLKEEEDEVFPAIKNDAVDESLKRKILKLQEEHEELGETLEKIKQLATDFVLPEWACPTFAATYRLLSGFQADIHKHIHLENNILFPKLI